MCAYNKKDEGFLFDEIASLFSLLIHLKNIFTIPFQTNATNKNRKIEYNFIDY